MNYHFTRKSANRKVGPMPTTVSDAKTCPDACPLKAKGCYAKQGPLSWHWKRVSNGDKRAISWESLLDAIRSIPAGALWRHNVAGDLPGEGDMIEERPMRELIDANRGKRGFTYTHKPMSVASGNAGLVKDANANGFTVNLSANNLRHADQLADLGIAPVVVVVPQSAPEQQLTSAGRKVIVCPAQTRDDITCSKCKLCSIANRKVIIGFRAHGPQKRSVDILAE